MTPSECRSLAQSVNRDIAGMSRAAMRQDGVKAALEQRVFRATEGHLEKSGFALSRHEHKKAAQRRLGKNPCATS
jgi:predicted lipoprotein